MIEKRYIELMNLEVDGVISDDDKRELTLYLEKNQEAKKYLDELRALTDLLDAHEEIEPPEAFEKDIAEYIFRDRRDKKTTREETGGGWIWRFKRRPALAFATGLAAGIVLFAFVYFTAERGTIADYENLYGTIGPAAEQAGRLDITAAGVDGSVKLYRVKGRLIARIALQSDTDITARIIHEGSVSFDGFRVSAGEGERFEAMDGRIDFTSHPGKTVYVVFFDGDEGSPFVLGVTLLSNGSVLYEGSIEAGRSEYH